jgi:hypothetical protein
MMASHYLTQAISMSNETTPPKIIEGLSKLALELGQADMSIDLLVRAKACDPSLSDAERKRLVETYNNIRQASKQKQQHGHDLLLTYLEQHKELWRLDDRKRCLVEVGTTREQIPGQGSTMLIAELCSRANFDFVTVDMDPNNGLLANAAFALNNMPFKAITQKGEVFLAEYNAPLDFVFLDAYDFDHGKHSALRQSRYMKYLGETIDEQKCHQMHLDCAKALVEKLTPDGLICVDDTWLDEQGNWTAKGTTAVPFLLATGFEIIESRNRAVLMKRKTQ